MSAFRTILAVTGGVAAGFVLAHLVNSTAAGRSFFEGVNGRLDAFGEAVREGYEARTQQLREAIDRQP